jgi:hypothetical protein
MSGRVRIIGKVIAVVILVVIIALVGYFALQKINNGEHMYGGLLIVVDVVIVAVCIAVLTYV